MKAVGKIKSGLWWFIGVLCACLFGQSAESAENPEQRSAERDHKGKPSIEASAVAEKDRREINGILEDFLNGKSRFEPTAKTLRKFGNASQSVVLEQMEAACSSSSALAREAEAADQSDLKETAERARTQQTAANDRRDSLEKLLTKLDTDQASQTIEKSLSSSARIVGRRPSHRYGVPVLLHPKPQPKPRPSGFQRTM